MQQTLSMLLAMYIFKEGILICSSVNGGFGPSLGSTAGKRIEIVKRRNLVAGAA